MKGKRTMTSNRPAAQRGMSLIGLLLVAILVAFVGLLAMRALPTVTEYQSIMKICKNASQQESTVAGVKQFFNLAASADYIDSITENDLEIVKEGSRIVISFAYDKEIPIMHPVYLVIKYSGSTRDSYQ